MEGGGAESERKVMQEEHATQVRYHIATLRTLMSKLCPSWLKFQ